MNLFYETFSHFKNDFMKQMSTSLKEPSKSSFEQVASRLFYDEITKEKIQRHLTDINDVITEEDIKNIDTSITIKQRKPQHAH
jgi:hypothetical protein